MGILETLTNFISQPLSQPLSQPWPWYVAGPLIGLTVPLLLIIGNRSFGISSSLKHVCAIALQASALQASALQTPTARKNPFFNYDWRKEGLWNLIFVAGIIFGGFVATTFLANPQPLQVATSTKNNLASLGIETSGAYAPASIFNWGNLLTIPGFLIMIFGGFLIGFGTRYAGGCTSGHAISGLANLQWPSLIAVIGFFIGGLLSTHFLLPIIFRL